MDYECSYPPDSSGFRIGPADDDASYRSTPDAAKPRAGRSKNKTAPNPPILLYNEHHPCSVIPTHFRDTPQIQHTAVPRSHISLLYMMFSPSRSQPTLSRSVLSTISRLFATPMADQLTESYSMPDVQLTEFPPSQRLGVSRPLKTPSLVNRSADCGSGQHFRVKI